MKTKPRAFIPFLLLLSMLFLSATLALSTTEGEDPELKQCKQQCRHQPHYAERLRQECERRCEEQRTKEEDPERRLEQCKQECWESRQGERQQRQCVRQCEQLYEEERRGQGEERGRQRGKSEDPEKRLEECRRECGEREEGRREQRECEKRCEEERGEHRGGKNEEEEKEEGKEEEKRGSDPYFFDEESLLPVVRTEHGHVRVLRNFLEKSKLLLGVSNYRIAIIGMNPKTFLLPTHFDAEFLLFVARGNGLVTLQCQDKKETHELRRGDILRVRAGIIVSFTNRDRNEKLIIVNLFHPVATPGISEAFVGASGQKPESFYRSFSKPILRAAFNTREDRLERLFGSQKKGAIIQASQEQIREISRQAGSENRASGESRRLFNLLDKRPSRSNRHGELREADFIDYPELRDLNIRVSFTNISKGSMIAPNYNTEATKIAVVVGGSGDVQIVRSRSSRPREKGHGQEEEERKEGKEEEHDRHYQRVESEVSCDTVFVVPTGHPSVAVASRNENLELLSFEINAKNNKRTWLAGRNNVLRQMDRVTKELAFDQAAREVDEVLDAAREEVFLAGPAEHGQERERGQGQDGPLGNSIL